MDILSLDPDAVGQRVSFVPNLVLVAESKVG